MKQSFGVVAIAMLAVATSGGIAQGSSICGSVVDEQIARPVEEAEVLLLDAGGKETEISVLTDADGRFCIDDLQPGMFHLRVEIDEYLTRNVQDIEVTTEPTEIRIGTGRSQASMEPPWPNPGSSRVSFAYELAVSSEVRLAVYDARGRLIRDWMDQPSAGKHELEWDFQDLAGSPVASGLYFIRLETPEVTVMRPLLRMR
jgi:hypothetical protein